MDFNFSKRIHQVKGKLLQDKGLEGFLLFDILNIRYLTGFTGSDGVLLLTPDKVFLLVDGRYTTQARSEFKWGEVVEYREKLDGVSEALLTYGIMELGFESSALSVADYEKLREKAPSVKFVPLAREHLCLRMVKDEEEIECLKRAAFQASEGLKRILEVIRPGLRESELAIELEYNLRSNGAQALSFPTIVASGENSSLPHAKPGRRGLLPGDAIVIDFGIVWEGYHSDETCTFFLGEASSEKRTAYNIVKEAHDRAIGTIRPGVLCSEVDRVAREYIKDKGWGKFFPHGTGHGIGLDIHEEPRLAPPSREILEEGMVVTVEPGIYLPGKWGIRLEDMVLVTRNGGEVLTKVEKELMVL